ncbi:MAG: Ig-like domain-containing protein [Chloroflexi bacterium]|nr:Ig-like domain-containing protein [Chloroflexota bacterium]MCI0580511.1 Ig-like domain-containing protein [Chloroflexota bacterium]MCI0643562.1 Ig-like domain-containing protein [Chloroflexota bacterium]MCI0729652.1 Ig-like domain-containing protein [Chloroflexota bacterium]
MIRARLFKLTLILLFVLVACRREEPTPTPGVTVTPTATAQTVTTPPGQDLPLIGDPQALPRPKVIGRSPTAGEELAVDGAIEIYFDQPMDTERTTAAWQVFDEAGQVVAGDISFPQPRILRFKPDRPLQANAVYHAEIEASAASTAGESLLEGLNLTFNTISDLAVSQTSPADEASDVAIDSTITVIFNRPVVPLLIAEEQVDLPNPLAVTPAIEGQGEWVNTSVYVFRPAAVLQGKTTYTVRVLADVVNEASASGSSLAGDETWSFTTAAPTYRQFDLVGVTVNPPANSTDLRPDQAYRIYFDQPMDRASTEAAVTLRPVSDGGPVGLALAWDDPDQPMTLTFTPTQLLELDTHYELTLATSAQAASGGSLGRGFTWRARTIPFPAIRSARYQYGAFYIEFAGPMAFSSLKDRVQFEPAIEQENGSYYDEYGHSLSFYGFTPSTDYTVRILPGMRDPYGNEISGVYTTTFNTPAASPYAQFGFPYRLVLLRQGGATDLYVTHRNVDRLDVALYQLAPSAMTDLLFGPLNYCSYTPSEQLWQASRAVTLPENEVGYARFGLAEEGAPPAPGLYFITLDSPQLPNGGDCTRDQGSILALVNANVTLKTTTTEAMVWVTDLETGLPLAGVPVTLYTESLAEVVSGVTDEDGLVYWDDLSLAPDYEGQYLALTGEGDVFGLAVSTWSGAVFPYNFGIMYDPYIVPGQPTVYVYTDRPLYRPGQPVSFKGIVRLNDDLVFSLPEYSSVQVTISSFDEIIFAEELPLSPYGSFEGQLLLDAEATLGDYTIEVRRGEEGIGYGAFDVAEYRKPTFQVAVSADEENVLAGETIEATVEATYFAGGAVANADVSWYVQASPFIFRPGGNLNRFSFSNLDQDTGYYFYDDFRYQPIEIIAEGVGVTDGQGRFSVEIPTDLLAENQGQELTIEASITDGAGNLVSSRTTVVVHPAELYAGIRPSARVSTVDDPVILEVALVDWAAEPVAGGSVTVELFERRWSSVQEEDARGQLVWRSEVEEIPVGTVEAVPLDSRGRGSVEFTVPDGGVYKALVSVQDEAGNMNLAATYFWVSGRDFIPWRRSSDNNFELIADSDNYRPGDTAELLIASPFQGEATALVTVERGHIKQRDVVRLTTNSTIYRLPITGDMAPNVVVSVLIVKGSDEFNPIPDFKVGMVQFGVDREEQELTVTITPDKTSVGPGDTVEYTVQVTDYSGAPVEAELSLALADLAALSLSARKEQPILDHFYSERFLSVSTALLLNRLIDFFNQEIPPVDNAGGGGGKGGFIEVGVERIRQNFPDTAYWEGQLQTGASGRATVSITLPDNLTTWRMDVRAVTLDTKVGQATVDIVSTKPLRVQPQTPRFFIVGDQVQLGTLLVNTTGEPIEATATLSAEGATLLDSAVQEVTIPANGEAFVTWDATITDLERVDLIFQVEGGGYADASTPPLATLPDGGLPVYRYEVSEVVGTSGQLAEAGAVVESIGLPVFPEWEISQAEVTVSVAPSLAAAMTDGLNYLEHFPYECTEQTISRFLPNVLTTRALREAGVSDPALEVNLQQQVEIALQRLYSRQRSDGGWPWWDQGRSDPIVSAYVLLGLVEARDAGYAVSAGVISAGRGYLQGNWRGAGLEAGRARYNRQAFLLYVLARSGATRAAGLEELYDVRNSLDIYGRAFLAQAIYLMDEGDPRLETLAADFTSQAIVSATGTHWEEESPDYWNWNTDTRTTAIVLAAMARIQPDNPLVANATRWLMAHRTDGRWQGTQETAWVLMGLTEFMVASGELEADYAYEIALNGDLIGSGEANAETLRETLTLQVDVADLFTDELNRLAIGRSEGGGNLYYTAHLEAAIPVAEVQALNRGIIISRRYFRADDPDTSITQVAQGETFLARLTIVAPNTLHYVMVEDYLPAGLEAVDTSLRTSEQVGAPGSYDWNRYLYEGWGWWVFDHVELRDEKVALSASLIPAGTYEYVYLVRAAIPGQYQVIPPTAWELYFPEVYGRGEGALFIVE